jgi:hypothetical protein
MLASTGREPVMYGGTSAMQTARPRDFGLLIMVIGMFLVLLVTSAALGSPAVR